MIRILFTTILLVLNTNLFASDKNLKMDFCENMSEYAETVMHNRQNGGHAIDSIRNIQKIGPDRPIKEFYEFVVKYAYSQPLWNSEENKKEAEIEFSNKVFLICLDTFK